MADNSMRSIFKNDSAMARYLDGDDDAADSDSPHHLDGYGNGDDAASTVTTTATSTPTAVSGSASGAGLGGATCNTGPKGVRADARAFRHAMQHDKSLAAHHHSQQSAAAATAVGTTYAQEEAAEALRQKWVEERLKALSKVSGGTVSSVQRVNGEQYLAILDSSAHVLLLILDDDGAAAAAAAPTRREQTDGTIGGRGGFIGARTQRTGRRLGDDDDDDEEDSEAAAADGSVNQQNVRDFCAALATLQKTYIGVRMISMSAAEAEMDTVACPAVLLYRDGALEHAVMRVTEQVSRSGGEICVRAVQQTLLDLNLLKPQFQCS